MIDRDRFESSSQARDPSEDPLPESWLPEPRPREDEPYWDRFAGRVVSRLEPEQTIRGAQARATEVSWVLELGARWKAAAVMAAAAVATLLLVGISDTSEGPRNRDVEDLALALVASEGDPVLLWEGLGMAADPLLAWLSFDGVEP